MIERWWDLWSKLNRLNKTTSKTRWQSKGKKYLMRILYVFFESLNTVMRPLDLTNSTKFDLPVSPGILLMVVGKYWGSFFSLSHQIPQKSCFHMSQFLTFYSFLNPTKPSQWLFPFPSWKVTHLKEGVWLRKRSEKQLQTLRRKIYLVA